MFDWGVVGVFHIGFVVQFHCIISWMICQMWISFIVDNFGLTMDLDCVMMVIVLVCFCESVLTEPVHHGCILS